MLRLPLPVSRAHRRSRRVAVGATLAVALLGTAGLGAVPASARTVWLCRPGLRANACAIGLDTTRFSPSGRPLGVDRVRPVRRPKVDCFYVYPTVSDRPTPQATLRIDPEERSIARYQAARYGRDCRVFAPMYRQVTIQGLLNPATVTDAMRASAYADVLAAWRDYLRHDNHGRGVVLIGHSQGTRVLLPLIAQEIDPKPAMRRRLVSALLLGGQTTVRRGSDVGGSFRHIRACRSARQLGCVVAFNTFEGPVPADSRFGRAPAGQQILCTNPAALAGGAGRLTPIYPREPFAHSIVGTLTDALGLVRPAASTPWLAFPGAFRARCSTAQGASVLQITPVGGAPGLRPEPDAGWGLHLADGNIALGQLGDLVRAQIARYARLRR